MQITNNTVYICSRALVSDIVLLSIKATDNSNDKYDKYIIIIIYFWFRSLLIFTKIIFSEMLYYRMTIARIFELSITNNLRK
jgi:hypothetical protein